MKAQSRGETPQPAWLLMAVLVQMIIGTSMVPLRYLQTVASLPSMAVIALSDLLAFSIMAWRMLPKVKRRYWRSKTLWIMVAIVIFRTICLTLAVRFTKVYLVQMINLLTPFLVVFLERFFNQSPLPRFTFLAMCLSTLGGVMMIFGELNHQALPAVLSAEDGLGIALAFLGTFGIALYMVIVKRGEQENLPFEAFYISQVGSMMIVMTILSISIGEDWHTFQQFDWRAGLALAFNAFVVEIGGKVGNITVIRKLGAPLVSSMQAVRLVAALLVGWVVLHEQLVCIWQWIGAILVIGTVTWYVSTISTPTTS